MIPRNIVVILGVGLKVSKANETKHYLRVAQEKLNALSNLAKENYIDLCFYEESHFGLVPVVPYAWQEKGATIELPSFRGKYINVAVFIKLIMNVNCIFLSKKLLMQLNW